MLQRERRQQAAVEEDERELKGEEDKREWCSQDHKARRWGKDRRKVSTVVRGFLVRSGQFVLSMVHATFARICPLAALHHGFEALPFPSSCIFSISSVLRAPLPS